MIELKIFDGSDYVPSRDNFRLLKQHARIRELMLDGAWRTLVEIENLTNDPPASISAQLRHLRKEKFGRYTVNKRHRGKGASGLYEYQVIR